jgi:hypothetical protein
MLLTFTFFAARTKLRKPAAPQPVAGKIKGSHTTRLLLQMQEHRLMMTGVEN